MNAKSRRRRSNLMNWENNTNEDISLLGLTVCHPFRHHYVSTRDDGIERANQQKARASINISYMTQLVIIDAMRFNLAQNKNEKWNRLPYAFVVGSPAGDRARLTYVTHAHSVVVFHHFIRWSCQVLPSIRDGIHLFAHKKFRNFSQTFNNGNHLTVSHNFQKWKSFSTISFRCVSSFQSPHTHALKSNLSDESLAAVIERKFFVVVKRFYLVFWERRRKRNCFRLIWWTFVCGA